MVGTMMRLPFGQPRPVQAVDRRDSGTFYRFDLGSGFVAHKWYHASDVSPVETAPDPLYDPFCVQFETEAARYFDLAADEAGRAAIRALDLRAGLVADVLALDISEARRELNASASAERRHERQTRNEAALRAQRPRDGSGRARTNATDRRAQWAQEGLRQRGLV